MNSNTNPPTGSEESLDKVRDLFDDLLHPTPAFTQLMANLKANDEVDTTRSAENLKGRMSESSRIRASTKASITASPDPATSKKNECELQALTALVVDYANGLTQMELAQKHGMHVQTVRKRLQNAGVNLRVRAKILSRAQLEAARSTIAGGASLRATARQFGVSHATLTRNLKPEKV